MTAEKDKRYYIYIETCKVAAGRVGVGRE